MNTQKGFSTLLGLLLVLAIAGGGAYFYNYKAKPDLNSTLLENKQEANNPTESEKKTNNLCKSGKVLDLKEIEECKSLAVERNDASICASLYEPHPFYPGQKNSCYLGLGIATHDSSMCTKMSDAHVSWNCYSSIAIETKKVHLCNLAGNFESSCLSTVGSKIINESKNDWKTYRNNDFGFEFKYPNEDSVTEKVDENGNLSIKFSKLDYLLSVSTVDAKDYNFRVGSDIGNFKYLKDQNIWYDEHYGNLCELSKQEEWRQVNKPFNGKDFNHSMFSTGDAGAGFANYIFINKDEKLILIGANRDGSLYPEEIELQNKIINTFNLLAPFDSVCLSD